jgi:hypothetical protein
MYSRCGEGKFYHSLPVLPLIIIIIIIIIIITICLFIFNCNWIDTRWQYYSTHFHTNSTQNTENGTYIIKRKNLEARAVPLLCKLYPGICLTTEEKARKNLS